MVSVQDLCGSNGNVERIVRSLTTAAPATVSGERAFKPLEGNLWEGNAPRRPTSQETGHATEINPTRRV